jgi:hypothetical protein
MIDFILELLGDRMPSRRSELQAATLIAEQIATPVEIAVSRASL